MGIARIGFALSMAAAVVALGSCVGNDPATPGTSVDSGPPGTDATSDAIAASDGGADAAVEAAPCDLSKPFGDLVQIVELSDPNNKDERAAALSEDEKRIFFVSNRDGLDRIYYAERGANGTFGAATKVAVEGIPVNDAGAYVERVTITADEKTLYFGWSELGNQEFKIWVAQRTATNAPPVFSTPELVTGIDEPNSVGSPFVNAAGTRLYYSAEISTNLFANFSVECSAPTQCGTRRAFSALGTTEAFGEGSPTLSRDEKTMYFGSARDGGAAGMVATYVTTRGDVNADFVAPDLVLSIRPKVVQPGWLSADGCRLYVDSNKNGNSDLYVMTRPQ